MKRLTLAFATMLLAACGSADPVETPQQDTAEAQTAPEPQPDCVSSEFEGDSFTHCLADPEKQTIRMRLIGADGEPLRSLASLALEADAGKVAFAMNGGMFDEFGMPIGYYVENGKRVQDINRADGPGNFHMKPNGIFFGTDGKWQLLTTDDFAAQIGTRPAFATQSGPMLLIDGKLHPGIAEDGESRFIRNAVGVDEQGRAHFVISDVPVSFGKLARFMRDELKTPNALYLDGKVSALWDPGADRIDTTTKIGPLIVVEDKAAAAAQDKTVQNKGGAQ